jgi:hypothetical protein
LFLGLIYGDLRAGFLHEAEDGEGPFPTVEVDGEHVHVAGLVLDDQPVARRVCSWSFLIIR